MASDIGRQTDPMSFYTKSVQAWTDGGKGENLLALAVKAAGLRATLGKISDACEKVVGRYKATIRPFRLSESNAKLV